MPVTKNSCAEDMILTSYHKLVLYFLSMGAVSLLALVVALAIIKCEVLTCVTVGFFVSLCAEDGKLHVRHELEVLIV
jgi:hypothetical protein